MTTDAPPAPTPSQVLAAGELPQAKYGGLPGFTGTRMVMPLAKMFAMITGPSGEGKSTFCQSHPGGYTINADKASTSKYVRGTVFPGVHPETGLPIDNQGNLVHLSWEGIKEIGNTLCALAEADAPRPDTIFYDSVDGITPLLINYILRVNDKKYWQDMDTRRAWAILYDLLVQEWDRLRNHGYGVYIITHIAQQKIRIAEDMYNLSMDLTIGDGLWKRIEWALEMVAGIEMEEVKEETRVKKDDTVLKDGTVLPGKEAIETVSRDVYTFTTYDPESFGQVLKRRITLPEMELPEADGWAAVNQAYLTAIGSP